jgi:ribosome-associated translation inhibitor RaiA
VRLSDENGPRGGRDKRCRIRVGIAGAQSVVIEDTEADLTVAIDRAAERAARVLVRRLERQRSQRSTAVPARATDNSTTSSIY